MGLNVSLNADYPLSGNNIGGFEAYMFATVKKFISEHTSFDEEIVIVDATGNVDVYENPNDVDSEFQQWLLQRWVN